MCCCRSASLRPIRRSTRRRCPTIRRRRRPSRGRLAAAGVGAGNPDRGRARERRQSVPALAVGVLCRTGVPAGVEEIRSAVSSSRPVRPMRRRRRPSRRDARARLARGRAPGDRRMRRVRSRRACARSSDGPRSISEATADRCTSRARPACRLWDCMDRHCRCDRSRFEARASSARRRRCTDLPCRPCDQRRCEPGDFRCLTGISAEAVAALAERARLDAVALADRDRTVDLRVPQRQRIVT